MKDGILKIFRFIVKYLVTLFGSVYLLTFGFLFKKNRDLFAMISRHFGYPPLPKTVPLEIPVIRFDQWITQSEPVRILSMDYAKGNVSLTELLIIAQVIAVLKPKRIFEFGTFDGRTTMNMAANSPENAVVYTLDLPQTQLDKTLFSLEKKEVVLVEKAASGARFSQSAEAQKIQQFYGDSAQFDYAPFMNGIDFVFIDASHAYEYVLSDSKNALKMLKDGKGVILWHDYGVWNGVTQALNELWRDDPVFAGLKHIEGTSLVVLCVGALSAVHE